MPTLKCEPASQETEIIADADGVDYLCIGADFFQFSLDPGQQTFRLVMGANGAPSYQAVGLMIRFNLDEASRLYLSIGAALADATVMTSAADAPPRDRMN